MPRSHHDEKEDKPIHPWVMGLVAGAFILSAKYIYIAISAKQWARDWPDALFWSAIFGVAAALMQRRELSKAKQKRE